MPFIIGRAIGQKLADLGVIPKNSRNIELHAAMDGPIYMRLEVIVDSHDMLKIAEALSTVASEHMPAEEILRTVAQAKTALSTADAMRPSTRPDDDSGQYHARLIP